MEPRIDMALNKKHLVFTVFAILTMTVLGACASAQATVPTAVTEVATATPVPIQAISIDSQADPEGFLAAIPAAEVDCASSAVGGRDELINLVSLSDANTDAISDTQLSVLASCISDSTMKRVVVGQLELETGGLSDETLACVNQYAEGIDFSSLFSGQVTGRDTIVSTLQALFCLSPAERAALESNEQSIIEITQIGGIDALECAVDSAGTERLNAFADIFSVDGSVDTEAVGEFMPYLIDCGVVDDDSFQSAGITSDQFSCLFANLDPDTLASLTNITDNPSATPDISTAATLFEAMGECGLDLQEILDSANGSDFELPDVGTGIPAISPELLVCLTDNGISSTVVSNYAVGLADTTDPDLMAALAICDGSSSGSSSGDGVVVPNGSGGTTTVDPAVFDALPITAEQAICLIDEVGAETLDGIAAGTSNILSVLPALGVCEISIADLLAG
jgi:hypothetical protein